uniref:FYVE, RhoGEF and PH domain-containing protein 1-like isoform X2 n=1 Tax=Styela clava TaxID=7725 RepID=UPI001939FF0B|nr:FYVE, RhoGEF and PH domain-containing protein 1-like isoform X2 [Styela clava]
MTRRTLPDIRIYFADDAKTVFLTQVPVKDKVALMESWNQGPEDPKKPKPRVPPKRSTSNASRSNSEQKRVPYRAQNRGATNHDSSTPTTNSGNNMASNSRRLNRDAKHRRSMSDPNLQKSFQAMKQLWDQKVEQTSKTQLSSSRPQKSRGSSVSSTQSNDSDQASRSPKQRPRGGSVKVGVVKEEKRKGPPTPTKPKPAHLRIKENHLGDARKKAHSTSDHTTAGNLVKNRAKMFDSNTENRTQTDRTSINRGKNRSSTTSSPDSPKIFDEANGNVSVRKLAMENAKRTSPRHAANNNKKSQPEELKSDLARLLDNEESVDKDNSEDLLISKMRRNSANLAKERRRNMRRENSNHSDSDSSCSATSSLSSTSVDGPLVTKRIPSREETNEKKIPNSPVLKSYLHRNASPKAAPQDSPPIPPPRRGSLSASERRESVGSISSSTGGALQTPTAPRRQSSLHKEHTTSSSPNPSQTDIDFSPTAALQRKLSIDAAKRVSMSTTDSGTGTVSPGINRNSRSSARSIENRDSIDSDPEAFKRGGSFSSTSSSSKTPPAPPPSSDKPTRARSASTSPMIGSNQSPPVKPRGPPPPPPTNKRPKSEAIPPPNQAGNRASIASTTTVSSRLSILSDISGSGSISGNFNDEMNRIFDVIATPTSIKRFRTDDGSSPESETQEQRPDTLNISSNSDSSITIKRDSLEVPSLSKKSGNSDNESWSDYDPSDDDGNQLPLTPSKEEQNSNEPAPTPVPLEVKIHNIAKELLSTEVTYVDVLYLIDQIFHKRVLEAINKKQIQSDVKNIFSNVSAIYQFHSNFLLPQLKKRLECWETNPKLGDIMTQAAPFLKMYSLYVQNFDEAMSKLTHWSDKSSNFAGIMKQTQAMPECGSLTLQHHMLGPVQRIPRYKMLLEDYLKRLPEDSPDRPEAETALELISAAAAHSNETMKQSDKFNKLLNVYNNLVDINLDFVNVSRELIQEGKIIKISARNGEKHERYLYLFNDMLLCCTPLRRLQKKSYKVTAKIDLDGMELVADVTNMTIPHTFCVNGTKKSMEFAANSPEDKEKWVNAINDAIDSFMERKTSFMKSGSQKKKNTSVAEDTPPPQVASPEQQQQFIPIDPISPLAKSPTHVPISFEETENDEEKRIEISCTPGGTQYVVDIEEHDLGKRAPRWIKDNEVTMCMNCSKPFNRLLRRRHHCRACGRVICTECSEHKLELQYDTGKTHKVCNKCYAILTGRKNEEVDKKGVLEVEADIVSGDSILSEYLLFAEADKRKPWNRVWCVIPKNELCLYVYGANQDVRAMMTMPLPGFNLVEDSSLDREFSFKLVQARKVLFFAASSQAQKQRWKFVFEKAAVGESVSREQVNEASESAQALQNKQNQIREDLQEEVASKLETTNGSRLSSSSAESATASLSSSSTINSDSSRPSSTMEKNNSFSDTNGFSQHDGNVMFEGEVES